MTTALDLDAPATLAVARRARATADAAEVEVLVSAVAWAAAHEVTDPDDAANWGDVSIPLAGQGAPLVSEFCIAEYAAALGMSPMAGRFYLAHALEIAHRLPRLYDRIQAGKVTVWRARRVAEKTLTLSVEAAAYVDAQVTPFAHKIGYAAIERLVDEAIARFMPQYAKEQAERAAETRKVEIHHQQVSFWGTSTIYGDLDLADAIDLDHRLAADAARMKESGSEDSLDVRRAIALGNLARGQATLFGSEVSTSSTNDSPVVEEVAQRPSRNQSSPRPITLYLHLDPRDPFGRLENHGNKLIAVEQIRDWLNAPNANITVRPVIDLNTEITCRGYEPSERLREQVILRDRTCVFPGCTRKARACDLDHVHPHDQGGPTTSSNLAPLCRYHHRLKTFGAWTYTMLEPGVFRWRSPAGYEYLRDQTGTRDLTPRPVDPPG